MSTNSKIKLDFFDFVIVFLFWIFIWLIFLGLAGLFKNYFIILGLLIFGFGAWFFGGRIERIEAKNYLKLPLILLFMIILFTGCLFISGSFAGDAINYWLPFSREITRQGIVPDLYLQGSVLITSRSPFLPLLIAATFSFFSFKEIFVFWIPIFFSLLTIIVLLKWWRLKEGESKMSYFIPLLFLANPLVLSWGWNILQEAMVLFFFTTFFYYFEKYEKEKSNLNLVLFFLSFVLALAAKETALLLLIPLGYFVFRYKILSGRKITWLILACAPMLFWWLRNYLIFGDPIYPYFDSLFGGGFYAIAKENFQNFPLGGFFGRFSLESLSQFLPLLPFVIATVYVFFKERKYFYFIMILAIFLLGQFWTAVPGDTTRYYYPLLGLFLIYFFAGFSKIKSRIFLSALFFVSIFGLFSIPVIFSSSSFISSLEGHLVIFSTLASFINGYVVLASLFVSIFFYFIISKKESAKYLILFTLGFYSVETVFIQLSWLNLWGPIFLLMIFIFSWYWISQMKINKINIIIGAVIAALLLFNTWGLSLAYFAANGYFPYPRLLKVGFLPKAGEEIGQLEGSNKDFYVLSDYPHYLVWYYDYKEIDAASFTFLYLTKLKYNNNYSPQQVHDMLRKISVKYVDKASPKTYWDNFFDKIKNQPTLFAPILEQDGFTLWKVI